jgi:hypothetical protein
MAVRPTLLTLLIAGLLIALLIPANPAAAGDRCVRPNTQVSGVAGPAVDRCLMVPVRPNADRVASDFGLTAGEPYDAQGNPVDRYGNIIAVSQDRSGAGRPLQVFVSDR